MIRYAIYELTTGKINRIVEAALSQGAIQVEVGEGFWIVSDSCQDDTHYIDINTGTEEPKIPFNLSIDKIQISADGIDTATFSGIPVGTEALIDYESLGVINDGTLALSNDEIETLTVLFQHVQYLDHEIEIDAV